MHARGWRHLLGMHIARAGKREDASVAKQRNDSSSPRSRPLFSNKYRNTSSAVDDKNFLNSSIYTTIAHKVKPGHPIAFYVLLQYSPVLAPTLPSPAMLRCRGPCPFMPSTSESGERVPAKLPTELLQAISDYLDNQSLGALRLTCKGVRDGVELLYRRSLREIKNMVMPPGKDMKPAVKQIQRLLELSKSEYAGEVRTFERTFLPTHSLATDWKSPDCNIRGLEVSLAERCKTGSRLTCLTRMIH